MYSTTPQDYYAEPWRQHETLMTTIELAQVQAPTTDKQISSMLGLDTNYAYIFSNYGGTLDAYVYNPMWELNYQEWCHYTMGPNGSPNEWNSCKKIKYVGDKAKL